MKQHTDEEIKTEVQRLWPDINVNEKAYDNRYFAVHRSEEGHIDLVVTAMYDNPGLTFDQLNGLAKFFDTMKVETQEEIGEGGCETCDYGSRIGYVLRISEGAPFVELNRDV